MAEAIPGHLAGVAAALNDTAPDRLDPRKQAGPAAAAAAQASLDALKEMRAGIYARSPVPVGDSYRDLARLLGRPPEAPETADLVRGLLPLDPAASAARIRALLPDTAAGDAEAAALAALEALRGGALARRHTTSLDDGRKVVLDWSPETGRAALTVESDGSGNTPAFRTTLPGEVALQVDPATGAARYETRPTDEAAEVKDADALAEEGRRLRKSILGDWLMTGGHVLSIAASESRAGEVAADPKAVAEEVSALRAEQQRLRDRVAYVWRNTETGAVERQERFRRLSDPWEYDGEQPMVGDLDERLAALDARIAALTGAADGPPPAAMRFDPSGVNEVKADPRARPVTLVFVPDALCPIPFDEAWFDGRRLAGRTTLTAACQMNEALPGPIRSQLAGRGWDSPYWLLAEVTSGEADRYLELRVASFGMLVTYDPDAMKVRRVHDVAEHLSGTAERYGERRQRYTALDSALP